MEGSRADFSRATAYQVEKNLKTKFQFCEVRPINNEM